MTQTTFKHPLFGLFTCHSHSQYGHMFGVLFDRAEDGRITDYRFIGYSGHDMPKSTAYTDLAFATDSGVMMPITQKAAAQMLAEIDTIAGELRAEPKIQRWHYTDSIRAPSTSQLALGRAPTNCVHFLMQLAQRAGIDVGALDYSCKTMDQVPEFSEVMDTMMTTEDTVASPVTAIKTGQPIALHYGMKALGDGMHVAGFSAPENTTVLEAVQALPASFIDRLLQSPPVMQPDSVTHDRVVHDRGVSQNLR